MNARSYGPGNENLDRRRAIAVRLRHPLPAGQVSVLVIGAGGQIIASGDSSLTAKFTRRGVFLLRRPAHPPPDRPDVHPAVRKH